MQVQRKEIQEPVAFYEPSSTYRCKCSANRLKIDHPIRVPLLQGQQYGFFGPIKKERSATRWNVCAHMNTWHFHAFHVKLKATERQRIFRSEKKAIQRVCAQDVSHTRWRSTKTTKLKVPTKKKRHTHSNIYLLVPHPTFNLLTVSDILGNFEGSILSIFFANHEE